MWQYTWVKASTHELSVAHLDQLYIIENYMPLWQASHVVPPGLSDHSLVWDQLGFPDLTHS